MTDLDRFDALDQVKQRAFLGLFAGARSRLQVAWRGDTGEELAPSFGKAECEWVDDWRDFYGRELPGLGWLIFTESEKRPALGMCPGSFVATVEIEVTEAGAAVREAWWARWSDNVDAMRKARDAEAAAEREAL